MTENCNISGEMKSLEINETVAFPIEKLDSVRVRASNINAIRQCKSLRTSIDREAGTITVTRIA